MLRRGVGVSLTPVCCIDYKHEEHMYTTRQGLRGGIVAVVRLFPLVVPCRGL